MSTISHNTKLMRILNEEITDFFTIVISIIAFILLIAVASTLQQAARLGSGGTVSIFAIEPSAQTALLWASGASILDTVALCYLHISCHSKVDYQA